MSKKYIEVEKLLDKIFPYGMLGGGNYPIQAKAIRETIMEMATTEVVEKEKYDHLLKAARKMHTWVFLNTGDEQAAYDEMGLSDEDNALLGYGGKMEFTVEKKDGDVE
jgi:hypothetical protein